MLYVCIYVRMLMPNHSSHSTGCLLCIRKGRDICAVVQPCSSATHIGGGSCGSVQNVQFLQHKGSSSAAFVDGQSDGCGAAATLRERWGDTGIDTRIDFCCIGAATV